MKSYRTNVNRELIDKTTLKIRTAKIEEEWTNRKFETRYNKDYNKMV